MESKSYTSELLIKVERYVRTFFKDNKNKKIVFHNLKQTLQRVQICKKIIKEEQVATQDGFFLICAAWFCTTGYLLAPNNPIPESVSIANGFLSKAGCKADDIQKILELINATNPTHLPLGKLEEVIADAIHDDDGSATYFSKQKLLRKQIELISGVKISRREWWEQKLSELSTYQYKTELCKVRRDTQKFINIDRLRERVLDLNISQPADEPFNKGKWHLPERGVETMFKISSNTNQRLSNMADNKAHLMITVNSIILSFIISLVLRRIDSNRFLLLPSLILLCVCLVTMILSILVTRPYVPKGTFSAQELEEKNVNLLYFGNFYNMDAAEYSRGMFRVMGDPIFLYNMLIKDVFYQGVILGRKYKLMRYAYNIFMYGLIVSVVAFIITSILNHYKAF